MIDIYAMQEISTNDLRRKVIEYVNSNIESIVRVLLDFMEEDISFSLDFFFPRDYLKRKPEVCRKHVYELHDILISPVIREYLKPIYKYLLYMILTWWEECSNSKKELIPEALGNSLKNELINNGYENIVRMLKKYDSYYILCFEDEDFLDPTLGCLVELYINGSRLIEYDNLDDYIELMDVDLRERYIEYRRTMPIIKDEDEYQALIVNEIVSVLKSFQKRVVDFVKRNEVEISADIGDAIERIMFLKYNLQVTREFPMGRAIKKVGETDLYLYEMSEKGREDWAVIENKEIENFKKQYDQLVGYLNQWFRFGITISINRKWCYQEALNRIENELKQKQGMFAPVKIEVQPDNLMIVSKHQVPENGKLMSIYHLVFNLYDNDRAEIARKARKDK